MASVNYLEFPAISKTFRDNHCGFSVDTSREFSGGTSTHGGAPREEERTAQVPFQEVDFVSLRIICTGL